MYAVASTVSQNPVMNGVLDHSTAYPHDFMLKVAAFCLEEHPVK